MESQNPHGSKLEAGPTGLQPKGQLTIDSLHQKDDGSQFIVLQDEPLYGKDHKTFLANE
jgi:hypothetical protein